jgi:hypothetical protein
MHVISSSVKDNEKPLAANSHELLQNPLGPLPVSPQVDGRTSEIFSSDVPHHDPEQKTSQISDMPDWRAELSEGGASGAILVPKQTRPEGPSDCSEQLEDSPLETHKIDSGEVIEIDMDQDPPARPPESLGKICNYESLSRLTVREHKEVPGEDLKQGVQEVLDAMSNEPETFTAEMIASGKEFLESIEDHILNANDFTAGSFGNSYPAWQELLRESKRQSSKKVLKWIKEGVKPNFEGVVNKEPAKLNRVKGLLRHAVPRGQVDSFLEGELPHEIQFENHRSVYEH